MSVIIYFGFALLIILFGIWFAYQTYKHSGQSRIDPPVTPRGRRSADRPLSEPRNPGVY